MAPPTKRVKITDHFRVALRPQDLNIQQVFKAPKKQQNEVKKEIEIITIDEKPPGVEEKPAVVDEKPTGIDDIFCEPDYALDSFIYDRLQEVKFRNRNYLDSEIIPITRAKLVDWLVQMQDKFALYHESLYMAVKIADQYLMRKSVAREQLRLLYMTSLFIATKFDERPSPVEIEDLEKESDNFYSREQIISFERDILVTLDFNIRYPLSYGFLRHFARSTDSNRTTLQLARYILESSLLEDEFIDVLESKIAAASLSLAFKLTHRGWNHNAQFYTGYEQIDLINLMDRLHEVISRPKIAKRISAVRKKYSHQVHFHVALKIPLKF